MASDAASMAAPIQREFGAQMKQARLRRKWSQRQLAAQIGVNPETITRVERGANTSIATLTKIQAALPGLRLHPTPADAADGAHARVTLLAQQDDERLAAMQARVIHLIQAIETIEQLQSVQEWVLRQLSAQLRKSGTVADFLPAPRKRTKGRTR
jgi:transcriptional regulator with XRE-family HTH domain